MEDRFLPRRDFLPARDGAWSYPSHNKIAVFLASKSFIAIDAKMAPANVRRRSQPGDSAAEYLTYRVTAD
jgi:hypothetical protein